MGTKALYVGGPLKELHNGRETVTPQKQIHLTVVPKPFPSPRTAYGTPPEDGEAHWAEAGEGGPAMEAHLTSLS